MEDHFTCQFKSRTLNPREGLRDNSFLSGIYMFFKHTSPSDAPLMAAAVVSACRINGWTNDIQPQFLSVIFKQLMQYDCDFLTLAPISIDEFTRLMPEQEKRNEVIDLMLSVEMLCTEIPQETSDSVTLWANRLGIHSDGVTLLRDLAKKSIALAQQDFYRTNYYHDKDLEDPSFPELENHYGLEAIMLTIEPSPELEARYEALQYCPDKSLGRGLWEFYKKRGFAFPGVIGSVNHSVAHHDWIHVLADYDSDGIGEMEVAAYSAMTTDSPGAVMAFLGVLSIFQGGLLKTVVGTAPHLGHELEIQDGPERIADALRRGKECATDLVLGIDFFDYANVPLIELQKKWSIQAKQICSA
jgi:hypothetical protein